VTVARLTLLLLALTTLAQADELLAEVLSAELGRRYDEPLLRRAAESPDPNVRAAAARAAGQLREKRAVGWLLPLMKDGNGRVRRATLFALGQIGDQSVVLPLRESIAALPALDRPHAMEALGKTRDARAVAAVVAHLTDPDVEVRNQAALALFRLGDASARTELFAALAVEKNAEPRWRQVYSLFRLMRNEARKNKKPLPVDAAQQQLLRDSLDPARMFHERVFAAMAVGATEGGGDALLGLLTDEDSRVVVAALRGLALGKPQPDALTPLLGHGDSLVREAVVDTWLAWKSAPQLAASLNRLDKRDQPRAHLVLLELDKAPEHQVEFVQSDPISEEWWYKLIALKGIEKLDANTPRTPRGLRALAEACGSDKIPEAERRRAIRKLLKNEDGTVRAIAVGVVAENGWTDEAPHVIEAARTATGPDAVDVRMEAAATLAKLELADAWLLEAARDPEFHVRQAAREALTALKQELPPEKPRAGLRLHGLDAPGLVAAAQALRGARVELKTSKGTMTMVLLPDEAPAHCVNFARLVAGGFYDNKVWHRVVADFVIQGGCPRGDGWGGPGWFVPDEIGTRPYVRGTVGMPKAGDDTGGCQIFITHLPTPHLDGRYSVYAQVVEGLAVIDRIRVGDRIEKATLKVR
jgi:cyclophilin family peptidyl-prolyl cis-trans isomerase